MAVSSSNRLTPIVTWSGAPCTILLGLSDGVIQMLIAGDLVLPDRVLKDGGLLLGKGRIEAVGPRTEVAVRSPGTECVEHDGYIVPGYIDMHVHGGGGADFMDGTEGAF